MERLQAFESKLKEVSQESLYAWPQRLEWIRHYAEEYGQSLKLEHVEAALPSGPEKTTFIAWRINAKKQGRSVNLENALDYLYLADEASVVQAGASYEVLTQNADFQTIRALYMKHVRLRARLRTVQVPRDELIKFRAQIKDPRVRKNE